MWLFLPCEDMAAASQIFALFLHLPLPVLVMTQLFTEQLQTLGKLLVSQIHSFAGFIICERQKKKRQLQCHKKFPHLSPGEDHVKSWSCSPGILKLYFVFYELLFVLLI